jgi:dihydrofolate reductase
MTLSLVVAVDKNLLIGHGEQLPWNCPGDLKHFKALTMGHTIIMGPNTYWSIFNRLSKPLPGRKTVVLASRPWPDYWPIVERISTPIVPVEDAFVIGGARTYLAYKDLVDKVYLSVIHGDYVQFQNSVYFPDYGPNWQEAAVTNHEGFDVYELVRCEDGSYSWSF